jgi:ATP-dependent Lhr-like helicase
MTLLETLDPKIRACIAKRGFPSLSSVQEEAIPRVLAREHVVLIAPTGTGKTESAMIPVFQEMLSGQAGGFSALYITPLRSLNRDMLDRLTWWCKELGLSVGVRHGDTSALERRRQAKSPPDLLITTPETLQAIFMGSVIRNHYRQVRYVIVDEIHELAGSKRGVQLAIALERLIPYAGEFQRIGLSATVGNPDEMGRFLCGNRPFSVIRVPVAKQLAINVKFVGDSFSDQAASVGRCIDRHRSTLIFVNTRVTAEALGHALYSRGDVEVHHGSLSREVRVEAEERFKAGSIRGLICTSSMELGIDIGHVEHVVQFGSPRVVARLVQRVGRAGHQLHTVSRGTIIATGFDDLLESLVIARRAREGEVEPVIPHQNAADVLANQVAALAVERREITLTEISTIICRTSLYPDLPELLPAVVEQMASHRLIRLDGDRVITTTRARRYLSQTLSMIHDERKIKIVDIVTRRTVGTLDQSFVAGWLHTGAVFVTKGQLWRVLDMEDDLLTVEPARHAKGEIPSWEGEQIPVPFAIAREVGHLRRTREIGAYAEDPGGITFATRFLSEMDRNRSPVPSDTLIVIEHAPDSVVCNICGGHRANEALARVLSVLISARSGSTVGIEIDAYRILLRLPTQILATDVKETITTLDPTHLEGVLMLAMKRTSLYMWKLIQIARKFGAIDADAELDRVSTHRLAELFDKTIVQKETYRELFSDYMDVPTAKAILDELRDGVVSLIITPQSILGTGGLFSSRDLVPPPLPDQAVISTLRRRIAQQKVILACMHCRTWKSETTVERVPDIPCCPLCGARLIAALKPWEDEAFAAVRKKEKSADEKVIEERLLRNANIVLSSGKKAVIALAARGVGPEHASRILGTLTDEDAFYHEILKAERTFVRTHRFW